MKSQVRLLVAILSWHSQLPKVQCFLSTPGEVFAQYTFPDNFTYHTPGKVCKDMGISRSLLDCNVLCVRDEACDSTQYEPRTHECWLCHCDIAGPGWVNVTGTVLSLKPLQEVFTDDALYFPMDEIMNGVMIGGVNGTMIKNADVSFDAIVGRSLFLNPPSGVSYGRLSRCFGDLALCNDGLTIALWLKLSVVSQGSNRDYYISTGGHDNDGFMLSVFSGYLKIAFNMDDWYYSCFDRHVEANIWYHYITTWDRERKQVWFYRNGCEIAYTEGMSSNTLNRNYPVEIGRDCREFKNYGDGYIDEMYVFESVKSTEFLRAFYWQYYLNLTVV